MCLGPQAQPKLRPGLNWASFMLLSHINWIYIYISACLQALNYYYIILNRNAEFWLAGLHGAETIQKKCLYVNVTRDTTLTTEVYTGWQTWRVNIDDVKLGCEKNYIKGIRVSLICDVSRRSSEQHINDTLNDGLIYSGKCNTIFLSNMKRYKIIRQTTHPQPSD